MAKSIFFNAHHAPIGAFSSFTLGYKGAKGGIASEMGKPADQSIFIGMESDSSDHFETFPFFTEPPKLKERFLPGTSIPAPTVEISHFPDDKIERRFSLCSDTWQSGDITFTIHSPVTSVPNPESDSIDDLKKVLIPAVLVELSVDNSSCKKSRKAFFGFHNNNQQTAIHHLNTDDKKYPLKGIAANRNIAICSLEDDVKSAIGFSAWDILAIKDEDNYNFGLGGTGLLVINVPAGEKKTYRFAVCFYKDGVVTSGIQGSYYYSKLFQSIEDVALHALINFDWHKSRAIKSEMIVDKEKFSPEQYFMMCQAFRSYYASTELISTAEGPMWIVNEGEYRIINTLDLMIDHLFFELTLNPWTIRNVLDWYLKKYSYKDSVHFGGEKITYQGGISFTHDMGVANCFSPSGYSSYELSGLPGCFSYMTQEQLVNWIICAGVYIETTNDTAWLTNIIPVLNDCLQSMVNRDHPDPSKRDGIMKLDSSRVKGGSEITTYDSLDPSLGQARENLYLALKCWAAYVLLWKIFEKTKLSDCAELAHRQACLCASTIVSHVNSDGFIPALFDGRSESAIIPAVEGLIYPWYCEYKDVINENGEFQNLIDALRDHLKSIMSNDKCLTADGGWKISSSSDITWLSKNYLNQFIATVILGMPWDSNADMVHTQWLLDNDNSYYCWSDQMINGKIKGSTYYPRGVTSILWTMISGNN